MFILEELFCDLDDFCGKFEPLWQSQLLSQGLKTRRRDRNHEPERNHDDFSSISSESLS